MITAIICGGKGTRLRKFTRDKPKSLVDVNGKPFIEWQLDLLRQAGYKDIVLCVGHRAAQMKIHNVICSYDEELGTGGAIKNAFHLLGDQFMTIYGDSYLECDYQAVESSFTYHRTHYGKLGMTTRYNHIDYGLGIFCKAAFDGFEGKFSLNEVYQQLALDDKLACYEMVNRFYEIGSIKGLEETCQYLSTSKA